MNFLFWATIGFAVAVVFSSFFEWVLHRFVMHQALGRFDYPFRSHALIHHQIFRADHTYHLQEERDKWTIPMAWWNGPVLVLLSHSPFLIVAWLTGHWGFEVGALTACSLYYATYEYIHWCMHLPRKRVVERSGLFFRLNGHHILHHRYMHKNFNVVLPLADFCLGTLLLRSKIAFPQPVGAPVPDLQPRSVQISFPRRVGRFLWLCLRGVKGA
jgi:hypothetical protein